MKVWTVANQKGGVGKTTTSVSLAGFGAKQGKRILLIDLDPQASLTCYFSGNTDETSNGVLTLFQDKSAISLKKIMQLLMPTHFDGITVLPASTALATVERQSVDKGCLGLIISKTVTQLKKEFDLIIIDSPPVLGVLLINALAACDRLIIPVQTEHLALRGLERMLYTLRMLEYSQRRELRHVIVPTMFDQRTQACVISLSKIKELYRVSTWPSKIPIDTRLRDASRIGTLPHLCAPKSKAIIAYHSLYRWLLKDHQYYHVKRYDNESDLFCRQDAAIQESV